MIVVFIIVVVFEFIFVLGLRSYYYGNVEQILRHSIGAALDVYDTQLGDKSLEEKAKFLLESQLIPDYVDAQVIDRDGHILDSSSRSVGMSKIQTDDFYGAISGDISSWKGVSDETGERIMAVSAPIIKKHSINGVIRFISSIDEVDKALIGYYVFAIVAGAGVLAMAFFISMFMATKVVEPVVHLKAVADRFAYGDFEKKAIAFSNDELGELADAFNYMAGEILKAEQLKNDFISSISHEIRTPLTSIMGWSETLLEGGSEEEQKMGLEIMSKETERLTGLVEDLLDFSKLEANRVVLKPEEYDLKALVDRTASQFSMLAKKRKIDISVFVGVSKLMCYGDMKRIKQVLVNVVDNSIKHGYYGGNIDIRLIPAEADKRLVNSKRIVIQVDDDGEGISESDLDKVTEMFYKGDDKKQGSGIGLAVSNRIVQLHGGKLEFLPRKPHGTRVNIEIPRRIENERDKV